MNLILLTKLDVSTERKQQKRKHLCHVCSRYAPWERGGKLGTCILLWVIESRLGVFFSFFFFGQPVILVVVVVVVVVIVIAVVNIE